MSHGACAVALAIPFTEHSIYFLRLVFQFCQTTSIGAALNIDEYVPVAIPIRSAKTTIRELKPTALCITIGIIKWLSICWTAK